MASFEQGLRYLLCENVPQYSQLFSDIAKLIQLNYNEIAARKLQKYIKPSFQCNLKLSVPQFFLVVLTACFDNLYSRCCSNTLRSIFLLRLYFGQALIQNGRRQRTFENCRFQRYNSYQQQCVSNSFCPTARLQETRLKFHSKPLQKLNLNLSCRCITSIVVSTKPTTQVRSVQPRVQACDSLQLPLLSRYKFEKMHVLNY